MVAINKDIFYKIISKFELPEDLDQNSIAKILKKYPAFNSLELLKAAVLFKTDKNLLDKDITNIATKVLDRKVLHDILRNNKLKFVKSISTIEKEIKTEDKRIEEKNKTALIKEKLEKLKIENSENILEKPKEISTNKEFAEVKEVVKEKELPTINKELVSKENNKVADIEFQKVEAKVEKPKEITVNKDFVEVTRPNKEKDSNSKDISARDNAFSKLSDDLFKDKLNAKKDTSEKEKRRIEAMKKLQEELFAKKEKPNKIASKEEILNKKPNKIVEQEVEKKKTTIEHFDVKNKNVEIINEEKQKAKTEKKKEIFDKLKDKIKPKEVKPKPLEINKESHFTFKTEEERNKELLAERKAKALILKIKAQQEDLVKKEEALHLQKIEALKKRLLEKKELEKKEVEKNTKIGNKENVKSRIVGISKEERIKEKNELDKKLEKLKEEKEKEKRLKFVSKIQKTEKNDSKDKIDVNTIAETKNTKTQKLVTLKTEKQKETQTNFLDWLKNKKEAKIVSTPKKEIQKEIITKTQNHKEEKEDIVPFERTSAIEAEMHKEIKKSSDPLDNFISKQISKRRKVRQKDKNKITKNIFATVTFAEILLTQQKYNEAIEVYSALSLKFPQKSIYFARQIEKIKTYL